MNIENIEADLREDLRLELQRKPIQPALEWVESNCRIRSGRFRARGYQRGWFHLWSNLNIPQKTTITGTQMGKTDSVKLWKEWSKIERRRRIGLWLVRGLDVTRYSAVKLSELYQLNPGIAKHLDADQWRTKGPTNNTNIRVYRNGAVEYIYPSQSAANFTDITCDDVVNDEFDQQPDDVEGQGAPDFLAFGRTDGVDSPNQICVGTIGEANPQTGKTKLLTRAENAGAFLDRRARCKNCQYWHRLFWGAEDEPGGFKFDRVNGSDGKLDINATADTVRHECPKCGHTMRYSELRDVDDNHAEYRSDAIRLDEFTGELLYIATGLPAEDDLNSVATKTPGFWNYEKSWAEGVRQFLEAARDLKENFDDSKMRAWLNTWCSEVHFVPDDGHVVSWEILAGRTENYIERYGAECPDGVQHVTAAMDLHEGGEASEPFVAAEIIGWGYGFENWSLDYFDEEGDCLTSDVVERVARMVLSASYRKKSGVQMSPSICAIDAGWQKSIAVAYQRSNPSFWVPTMGHRRYGQPVFCGWPDKPDDDGAHIVYIGTDTAKDQIYAGFNTIDLPGPGYSHFPSAETMPGKQFYNSDYFKGLVSETVKILEGKRKYVKRSSHIRNEPLDTRVMNLAMMRFLMSMGADFVQSQPELGEPPPLPVVQQNERNFSAPTAQILSQQPKGVGRRLQHKRQSRANRYSRQ